MTEKDLNKLVKQRDDLIAYVNRNLETKIKDEILESEPIAIDFGNLGGSGSQNQNQNQNGDNAGNQTGDQNANFCKFGLKNFIT